MTRPKLDADRTSRLLSDVVLLSCLEDSDGPCAASELSGWFVRRAGESISNRAVRSRLDRLMREGLVLFPSSRNLHPIEFETSEENLYILSRSGKTLLARRRRLIGPSKALE